MEYLLVAGFIAFMLWLFFEFPGLILIAVVVFIGVKACGPTSIEDAVESIDEAVEELVQQTQESTPTESVVIEDSVKERCLDGIMYLLVVENGQSFMAPKEDTFGYNVKCSD